jgi:D-alanyl-lipoteichoic acid acyltransferase DltB (MBOAT superfamily)
MNWQPLYGCLILFITISTWLLGILVGRVMCRGGGRSNKDDKKLLLVCTFLVCFGVLFIFKYANFISSSINELFLIFHIKMQIPFLNLLLPVGISFYAFQAVGYVVDIYKGNIKPENNFFIYAIFLSFFPQLVAGPIERAKNLLPQFYEFHVFTTENITRGLRLILWGYFMKVVIADRLAVYVDSVYNNASHHNGTTLVLATFFFTFQIYCDFGGYSNIAIGCANVMGFDLMTNFKRPYLAVSITDFWRRWHISLSTWFKDYLYIPLGGNRRSRCRNYYNLILTFIVSGIWHGANWTFVIWGLINGIFQIMEKILTSSKKGFLSFFNFLNYPKLIAFINRLITFILVAILWIFFRANNINDAFIIFNKLLFSHGELFTNNIDSIIYGLFFIILLIISDIFQEWNDGKHIFLENEHQIIRYSSYIVLILTIIAFGVFDSSQFIYFQF